MMKLYIEVGRFGVLLPAGCPSHTSISSGNTLPVLTALHSTAATHATNLTMRVHALKATLCLRQVCETHRYFLNEAFHQMRRNARRSASKKTKNKKTSC